MKIQLTAFIPLILFLVSCGNTANEKLKEQAAMANLENHHHEETETIALNNGEKWKVDPAMLLHIRNMEEDITAFGQDKQKDHKGLARELQTNLDLLTSNCTMQGQAHDELHKWLLPYIDLVNELSEATSETETAQHFKDLKSSFRTFNQYFE